MKGTSAKCAQTTSRGIGSATSSPASRAGRSRSVSRDGQASAPCGPAPAPANRSARRGNGKARRTPATSGPSSSASSPSAVLQRSLESRLRAATDVNGSLECVLTWKHWDMPSGPPICALRARARRTSDSVYSGSLATHPTPTSQHGNAQDTLNRTPGQTGGLTLAGSARLACHPTPDSSHHGNMRAERVLERMSGPKRSINLEDVTALATHATPQATDDRNTSGGRGPAKNPTLRTQTLLAVHPTARATDGDKGARSHRGAEKELERKGPGSDLPTISSAAIDSGTASTSLITGTARKGVLNPEHSRWLMGYPAAWGFCGVTAMQSSRKSRRPSSRRS